MDRDAVRPVLAGWQQFTGFREMSGAAIAGAGYRGSFAGIGGTWVLNRIELQEEWMTRALKATDLAAVAGSGPLHVEAVNLGRNHAVETLACKAAQVRARSCSP